jgi:cytochrome P460
MMKKSFVLLLAGLGVAAQMRSQAPQFNADGHLLLPKNYREWVYLSSGLGMTYGPAAQADGGNPMFDNVFVERAAYRAFVETGKWPDKTMFILEIRRAAGKGSINNAGHYQTEVVSVESAVKDEARFPQKWAYFNFGRGDKAAPLGADSNCNSCHSKSGAVENTFVQFYPTLLEVATAKGTLRMK